MLTTRFSKQRAFTLVELLLALLLGTLLLTMIINIYSNNIAGQTHALQIARMRTDLQHVMSVMENDLRRAGYGGSEFLVGNEHHKVIDILNNGTKQCIIYAYNTEKSLSFDASYVMGFRYLASSQSIQFGHSVSAEAKDCFTTGFWNNLTDPHFIQVVDLEFIESVETVENSVHRSVNIELTAKQPESSEALYQLHTFVHVRNTEAVINSNVVNNNVLN